MIFTVRALFPGLATSYLELLFGQSTPLLKMWQDFAAPVDKEWEGVGNGYHSDRARRPGGSRPHTGASGRWDRRHPRYRTGYQGREWRGDVRTGKRTRVSPGPPDSAH